MVLDLLLKNLLFVVGLFGSRVYVSYHLTFQVCHCKLATMFSTVNLPSIEAEKVIILIHFR